MTVARKLPSESHVVDILGSTKGRDQPIMLMAKAIELASEISKESYLDPNVVFLDPFCKAGEIILATAIRSCMVKNKHSGNLLSIDEVETELYQGRYFGLGIDKRHFLLSRRTFYGNEISHNQDRTIHIRNGNYLSEIDGRLDREKFKKEFGAMINFIKERNKNSKIIAIGNPPYQESDGGFGRSASPIYNIFVEALMKCDDISEFILVIPSRWFSGGKGLDGFRNMILQSNKVKLIKSFKDPREIFPTVDINGGVCFLNVTKSRSQNHLCRLIEGNSEASVNLSSLDAIPDDLLAYELIEKIKKRCSTFMSEIVIPQNPFGIRWADIKDKLKNSKEFSIDCLIKERKVIKVSQKMIRKNEDLVSRYKVVIPRAVGGTKAMRDFLPIHQFFIVKPKVIVSETYFILSSFDSEAEAKRFLAYLQTAFCRYFIGLRKLTQDISVNTWKWVPWMDPKQKWNDEKLFDHFNLTRQERNHIIEKVKQWS